MERKRFQGRKKIERFTNNPNFRLENYSHFTSAVKALVFIYFLSAAIPQFEIGLRKRNTNAVKYRRPCCTHEALEECLNYLLTIH